MESMITAVSELMIRLQFPRTAAEILETDLRRILAVRSRALTDVLRRYEETENCDYLLLVQEMQELCGGLGIGQYRANLLLFLTMAPRLQSRYVQKGIEMAVFYDSLADLRYKLEECILVKGEIGTFVPQWYAGFFNLTRFALGRLQFERRFLKKEFSVGATLLPEGTPVLNVHIPRTGTRLDHTAVMDAYEQAARFFPGESVIFTCHSWMLYPWNMTVLPQNSNMAAFFRDYTIVESGDYPDYREIWRLFDCHYEGDPDKLPADTSLRRAYIRRIREGKPLGWGRGLFIYR